MKAATYTFKLREKVTFQDGTAFDAAAVCTNFNRWFNFSPALRKQAPGTTFKGVFKAHADQASAVHLQGLHRRGAGQRRGSTSPSPSPDFLQALTLPGLRHLLAQGPRRRATRTS